MLMAPRNPRLPTVEHVANRVCSERNPMPNGTDWRTWEHPETRIETRAWWSGSYQAECCAHCGKVMRVTS